MLLLAAAGGLVMGCLLDSQWQQQLWCLVLLLLLILMLPLHLCGGISAAKGW
jgi:hypothetical protein